MLDNRHKDMAIFWPCSTKVNIGPTNFNRGSALFGLYFNRGTASRHCPEGLPRGTWVSFDVVDGPGVVRRSQSGDDVLAGGGGGADAAASDVEVLLM